MMLPAPAWLRIKSAERISSVREGRNRYARQRHITSVTTSTIVSSVPLPVGFGKESNNDSSISLLSPWSSPSGLLDDEPPFPTHSPNGLTRPFPYWTMMSVYNPNSLLAIDRINVSLVAASMSGSNNVVPTVTKIDRLGCWEGGSGRIPCHTYPDERSFTFLAKTDVFAK